MLATDSRSSRISEGYFLVRLETMGHVGRFRLTESLSLSRTDRVVCRSVRGIEVGSVLAQVHAAGNAQVDLADGRVLRKMTPADQLLWGELRQLADEAHATCVSWLQEQQIPATLLEVEPLLDGRTLYFHFLNEVGPDIQSQLDRLVSLYEQAVQASNFARMLEQGCGPDCGTQVAGNGCESRGGCAVCHIAGKCGK